MFNNIISYILRIVCRSVKMNKGETDGNEDKSDTKKLENIIISPKHITESVYYKWLRVYIKKYFKKFS